MPNITGQFVTVKFDQFFDRSKVQRRMDQKERRVLVGTGAFGRTAVKRSIRSGGKKGKTSSPGEPPRFHTRGQESLKDRIFFGYDQRSGSVVIGPQKFNGNTKGLQGASTVPELLEKGGSRVVSRRTGATKKTVSQAYKPRPFVGEGTKAFEATTDKMNELMERVEL